MISRRSMLGSLGALSLGAAVGSGHALAVSSPDYARQLRDVFHAMGSVLGAVKHMRFGDKSSEIAMIRMLETKVALAAGLPAELASREMVLSDRGTSHRRDRGAR